MKQSRLSRAMAFADYLDARYWLWYWLAALGILMLVASYLDRSAALRGTYGQQPSWIADKLLRLFFFVVLVSPTLFTLPWLAVLYIVYLPSYLDGCVLWAICAGATRNSCSQFGDS